MKMMQCNIQCPNIEFWLGSLDAAIRCANSFLVFTRTVFGGSGKIDGVSLPQPLWLPLSLLLSLLLSSYHPTPFLSTHLTWLTICAVFVYCLYPSESVDVHMDISKVLEQWRTRKEKGFSAKNLRQTSTKSTNSNDNHYSTFLASSLTVCHVLTLDVSRM